MKPSAVEESVGFPPGENSNLSRHNPKRVRIWRELIDAWERSWQSINAFFRDQDLTRLNFNRCRRILTAPPSETRSEESSAFVPLRILAEPMVEVVLRSGVVVRLPVTAAPEAITRLVATVGAASC